MIYQPRRMDFGIFLAPYHALGENPTLALRRDMELIQVLDRLGFDEAWVGEHHSMGRETIVDPVSFIAYAAALTQRIRLGTGVVSLSYHHPLTVADRIVQLDHLTMGRVMLGVGPGALTSDARMMGIDPLVLRRRMNESLDAIMALLRADAPISMETDWFRLCDAAIQLPSYTIPHVPVAVAAILSPSGPTAAGRNGVGVISVGGFDDDGFSRTWEWAEEAAAAAGQVVDRGTWRVVAPVHIAETREQAIEDVREGFRYRAYFGDRGQAAAGGGGAVGNALGLGGAEIEEAMELGSVIVGSPDDAIAALQQIQQRSGGFGAFLALAHEWATPARTHRSYELWARHVAPVFQHVVAPVRERVAWAEARASDVPAMDTALRAAFRDAGKAIPAEVDRALAD